MKYIGEYIPKSHIHQHSLLTRKVFFRHNFQRSSSSLYQLDHLCLQVIFGLQWSWSSIHIHPSNLNHLSIWIIMRHHQWIWIISRSGSSSLDLDHLSIWININRSGSSLDLDHHHWIWIITWSGSSLLDHHCWIIITRFGSSLDLDHHWVIITGAISWFFSS